MKSFVRSALPCVLACSMVIPGIAQVNPQFNAATVKPCVDDINGMLGAMKSVVTAQQAAMFADKLRASLPGMLANQQRLASARAVIGISRSRTAEMTQADALLREAVVKRPELETEMARLEKLNVGLAELFDKFRTSHY